MKRVFISARFYPDEEHPLATNIMAVKSICNYALKEKYAPFAAHLLYPMSEITAYYHTMLDNIRSALAAGQAWLPMCQEIWQRGETVTPEMENQISLAKALGIPIRVLSVEEKWNREQI